MEEKRKLKRGERRENWKEYCKRFKEYYKRVNPDWTEDQCIEAASIYCKSTSWQNIEYWIKKYPELTRGECERKLKEKQEQRKRQSKFNIEYYEEHYPELSHEDQMKMLSEHAKAHNFQNIEYYKRLYPDKLDEELNEILSQAKKSYVSKRPNNSGINNPAHHSKTTELERRQRSPKCIEFYELKYPELTHEEHLRLLNEHIELVKSKLTPDKFNTKIEYWLAKGYSEEESRKILKERQHTFTLEKCIAKYGEEEGTRIFKDRQIRWQKSLKKNFEQYGDGRSPQSFFAHQLIEEICSKLNIDIPSKEKYMTDKTTGKHYAYDFIYKDKIIEFNGDYWHANPNMYDETFYNKIKQMHASDIWEYDKLKRNCAVSHGYKVLYIWEEEYNKDFDSTINKCLNFLTDD